MTPREAGPANPEDLGAITALLTQAELPTDDLAARRAGDFLVVRRDGQLGGVIGLEAYGASGLLRSLAVAPADRGTGLGKQLVAALETQARGRGIKELWLLTTTAAAFFSKLGYRVTDRAGAPEAVRRSAEFTSLCPSSAVCMVKTL